MAAQRARAGGLSPPGGSRVPAAAEEGQLGPAHVEGPGVARLTSIAGFTLQLAAITAAGVVIAYVSMAIWYWRSRIPHAQYGRTDLGLLPRARRQGLVSR